MTLRFTSIGRIADPVLGMHFNYTRSWCAGYRDSLDFETCLKCGRVFCASCVEANLGKDPFADKDLLAGI